MIPGLRPLHKAFSVDHLMSLMIRTMHDNDYCVVINLICFWDSLSVYEEYRLRPFEFSLFHQQAREVSTHTA